MVAVKPRWEQLSDMLPVAIVAACPLLVWLMLGGNPLVLYAVLGLTLAAVGVYIGLRHPLWLFWGLAAVLGAIPAGYFPGVHVPLYLPLAFGTVLAAIIHPSDSDRTRLHPLEVAVLLLICTSALSLVATGRTLADFGQFTKWIVSTSIVFALLRLSRENMAKFGRIYVYAASFNSLIGILTMLDPQQRLLLPFKIFGYGAGGALARYFYTPEEKTVRLGGLWVDSNAAGIGIIIGLALCILLLRGRLRFWLAAIQAVALVLTLSRATIFSAVVGLILVLAFTTMRFKYRQLMIGGLLAASATCVLVPFIRTRIFTSFGSNDKASQARADALRDFPHLLSGHWSFGLGWGRPEFVNGTVAYNLNHVANAPLLTVHRGGVFAGAMFVLIIIVGCIVGYRCLRAASLPIAIYGGLFIGFVLVACQLDHGEVGIPQTTSAFSILLAFLVYADESRRPGNSLSGQPPDRSLIRKLVPNPG
jgi:hypothetical protein